MDIGILLPIGIVGLVGLGFAANYAAAIRRHPAGSNRMIEISGAIREGAMTFLRREFMWLAGFVVVIALLLGVFIHALTGCAFVFGAVCSARD